MESALAPLCSQSPQFLSVEDETRQASVPVFVPCGQDPEAVRRAYHTLHTLTGTQAETDPFRRFFAAPEVKPLPTSEALSAGIGETLFTLLTLGIFSATACSPIPPATPEPAPDHPMKVRADLIGDARIGTLVFLRQQTLPFSGQSGKKLPSEALVRQTGLYQAQIYSFLKQHKPRHLFLEGLDQDLPPSSHDRWVGALLENLRTKGLDFSEAMSPEQKEEWGTALLAVLGGGILYAMKEPEVSLHKTLSPEAAAGYESGEVSTTRELIGFFSQYPGTSAVLIYGAEHQFCDDFQRSGVTPRMASVWWDLPGNAVSPSVPPACQ